MFNISALKEMKLVELQEIAKLSKTIKVAGAKKDTLIAQILEHQNTAVTAAEPKGAPEEITDNKTKRVRILPESKMVAEMGQSNLFTEEADVAGASVSELTQQKPVFENKNPKFKKPLFKKDSSVQSVASEEQPTENDIEVTGQNEQSGQSLANSNQHNDDGQLQKSKPQNPNQNGNGNNGNGNNGNNNPNFKGKKHNNFRDSDFEFGVATSPPMAARILSAFR